LIETFVVVLLVTIFVCFSIEMTLAAPPWGDVARGFVPRSEILTNPAMLYIAIGIMGATVMPHNLYLHSSIVQTRAYDQTPEGRREAVRFATIDSTLALLFALTINAAILILAAATFHGSGHVVVEIQEAHRLLAPALGASIAATAFALALLASGQNSAITATVAGQIVMEGFLSIRLPPFLRRLITRGLALAPALFVTAFYGDQATGKLLVFSQVVLSAQLPFAVVPLILFTASREKMGVFVISRPVAFLAWLVAGLIVALNLKLIVDLIVGT
jgi:manganese transport protein